MGELDALRVSGGPARIKLQANEIRAERNFGIGGLTTIAPAFVSGLQDDDIPNFRKLGADGGDGGEESLANEEQLRLGIVDRESDLRGSQPCVHRDENHAGLRGTQQELEKPVAV